MKKKLGFRKGKKENIENTEESQDPRDYISDELKEEVAKARAESGKFRFRKKNKEEKDSRTVVRVEDLERILRENNGEIDEETLLSLYVPQRKVKRFAGALLRLDKLHLILYGLIALLIILFMFSFVQEKSGNFTINLNRLELFRKGVSIDESGDFRNATARLTANAIVDATNISIDDLPKDIDSIDGDHNGNHYVAYTYYVRNAGKEDLDYVAKITLDRCAKGAEEAVRVAVWKNGKRVVYAEPAKDGGAEKGCVSFKSHDVVCEYTEENFLVGNVDKYTIAIWLEGDDPECVDKIVGGTVQFSMSIDGLGKDDSRLIVKYLQDIWDTLFGGKDIGAAGNEAPDYFHDEEITWENRRNKDNTEAGESTDNKTNTESKDKKDNKDSKNNNE